MSLAARAPRPLVKTYRSGATLAVRSFLVITSLILLAACGKKGDPLPPQSFAPVAARDLALHQQGTVLIVDVGYPQTTSSGTVLPGLESLELWTFPLPPGAEASSITAPMFSASAQRIATVTGPELSSAIAGDRIRARIALDDVEGDGSAQVLAVRTVSTTGDVSLPSNLVVLSLGPPPSAPFDLTLQSEESGVRVSWSVRDSDESPLGYHVYRKQAAERTYGSPVLALAGPNDSALDESAMFGERYFYTVRSVRSLEPLIESDAAVEKEIEHLDVFAPRPPVNLTALPELGRVRLLIDPSPASDVAGYVIYRRESRTPTFRRINDDLLERLEYLDRGLAPGLTYEYRASAVDLAGNEGEPGPEVTVSLP